MTDTSQSLGHLPALAGLDEAHLQQLATVAKLRAFPAGKTIFREGEPANDVYFIATGNVGLDICAPAVGCRRILTIGAGELLGWSPLFDQHRLTATARALSEVQAWVLSGAEIQAMCASDPRFGYEFMRRAALAIAQRLSATRLQLLNVYGDQMPLGAAQE